MLVIHCDSFRTKHLLVSKTVASVMGANRNVMILQQSCKSGEGCGGVFGKEEVN